jgi:type I restriction enzyme S subunit
LTSTNGQLQIDNNQAGGAREGINFQQIAKLSFSFTSEAEQTAIGNFFRNLDDTISLAKQQHEKTVSIKKAMLQKMFPKKGAAVPEIRFEGFDGDWEEQELEFLADFAKGSGYSKSDLAEEGFPIILYGQLYTRYETVISQVETFVKDNSSATISKGNEVLVPSSGETAEDISRASVIEQSGVILGGDLNIIRPKGEIGSVFLALSISHSAPQREMMKRAQGKTIVHLHNSDLKTITLQYPRKKEQAAIGNFFRNLDTLIEAQCQEIEKLQNIKNACLNKMFV